MKIESITINNFKRFDNLTVSFKNKTLEEVSNRFLVLGDNGSGKTTLLQAITLPLALATRQIQEVSHLDWVGFVPGRYQRWGEPRIDLVISFSQEEIDATREVARRWDAARTEEWRADHPFVEPGDSPFVALHLSGGRCRAKTPAEYFQFLGRHYARQLLKTDPSARQMFRKLPGLFWFDQYRNLGSNGPNYDAETGDGGTSSSRLSYEIGVAQLRRYLNGWKLAQTQPIRNPDDYLTKLEGLYKRVFPNRSFAGVEPMPGIDSPTADEFYFLLNDGNRDYDIEEMSAGEQSVFPLLYEIVRQHISNSIVLIDEVDLNLHPPAAQLLVRELTKITENCQFILTTHSESVNALIGDDETYRLPGGSLCL